MHVKLRQKKAFLVVFGKSDLTASAERDSEEGRGLMVVYGCMNKGHLEFLWSPLVKNVFSQHLLTGTMHEV
jgi:hypothetical protein